MTSEAMTNELIEGIARKKTSELRNRLRNVDVLMVDDVQFLSKTKATQEEFFHTFNSLHDKKKQIIIASDRPPKELPEIEERLRSRFEWGVIVDIQKPGLRDPRGHTDAEGRRDGHRRALRRDGIHRPERQFQHPRAGGLPDQPERPRGADEQPITLELARTALAGRIGQAARAITPELIIEMVARQYDTTPEDITGKNRSQQIALPRQVAMYICREMTEMSTTAIGQAFGGRDHTTVMHGCDKVAETMETDFAFKNRVEELIGLHRKQLTVDKFIPFPPPFSTAPVDGKIPATARVFGAFPQYPQPYYYYYKYIIYNNR